MLLAQGVSVSGVVVYLNGESLPGVNVVEVGTNNGTITDFDGRFVLNVSSSKSTIRISFPEVIAVDTVS
jgi:hypothetical protein